MKFAKALQIEWFLMADGDAAGQSYVEHANNHLAADETLADRAKALAPSMNLFRSRLQKDDDGVLAFQLIHELSKRLDAVCRYDQYIANAEGKNECQELWRTIKKQDMEHIEKLKSLIKGENKSECF